MVSFSYTAKDGTQVIFREPLPKDAAQMMKFINAFVDEKKSGLLINKKCDLKGEKEWLRGRLSSIRNRKTVMLLAELNGKMVGNCDATRLPWKSSHVAECGIALSKEVRGKGIGEALMSKTIELAQKRMRGLEMLFLKTMNYNKKAQALYRKIGFVEVGRIPRANKEGNEYDDDVLMIRYL